MHRRMKLRPGLTFLVVVACGGAALIRFDVLGHMAYALERGKLEASREYLASLDPKQLAGLEQLSQAFSVICEAVKPSVVNIKAYSRLTREEMEEQFDQLFELDDAARKRLQELHPPRTTGAGSGVVVDEKGYILTNNHVVDRAEKVEVRLADGRTYWAEVVGTDVKTDLAMLKIKADRLFPARMGDSDRVKVGNIVLAIGSPFRLDHTVSHGIISALGRNQVNVDIEYQDFIQTDAAINPGNSGGPLINTHGEVIGITTAIATESGGHQGVGFAIASNTAKYVSDFLRRGEEVARGYLGVALYSVSSELAEQCGLPKPTGVVVTQVIPKTPAADAGLRFKDLILEADGRELAGPSSLQGVIASTPPGQEVKLRVLRDRKRMEIPVVVGRQPQGFSTRGRVPGENQEELESLPGDSADDAAPMTAKNGSERPSGVSDAFQALGFEAETVSPALIKKFGLNADKTRTGAVVTQVDPEGAAYEAGLRRGLVIIGADSDDIKTAGQLRKLLSNGSLEKGIIVWADAGGGAKIPVVLKQQ